MTYILRCMKPNFHHIWSRGVKVIFHDRDDFKFFQNRLAIISYNCHIKLLAYSIMSTHFHLIAEGNDIVEIEQFITLISRCYSLHF